MMLSTVMFHIILLKGKYVVVNDVILKNLFDYRDVMPKRISKSVNESTGWKSHDLHCRAGFEKSD